MPRLLREGVSETCVRNTADEYTPMLNRCIALVHRMLTGKDVVLTGKVRSFVLACLVIWLCLTSCLVLMYAIGHQVHLLA
jgi:hypothetical protein